MLPRFSWLDTLRRTFQVRPVAPHRRQPVRPSVAALEERALMTAGALDPSFNGTGKIIVPFDFGGDKFDVADAVAVDALGRTLVVGSVRFSGTDTDFAVLRLNPDGTPDTTFGPNHDGKVTIAFDLGGNRVDVAHAVAIDRQGRIVVAGEAATADGSDFAVARLIADGTLDNSFSGDGRRTIDFGGPANSSQDRATGLIIDGQGRIVLAGSAQT